MAFDSAGNLWITSYAGIVRFDGVQRLGGAVTASPTAVIAKVGFAGNIYFYGLAFDANGALWASAAIGDALNSVVKFASPGSLSGSSSPVPDVTIAGVGDWLPAGGLAFDPRGNLWAAASNAIIEYADPGRMSGSVVPAASATMSVFNDAAPTLYSHLVFFPAPPGLPLY